MFRSPHYAKQALPILRLCAVPEPLVLKDDKNTMEVVEMAQKMLAR
jgi:hypothetical protein